MSRSSPFNRGLVSPKALARVDLDRTRLSAEVYTNWLPKTQGAMTIRPGTKFFGSSLNDTGAEYIEFVASTDDVALAELTHGKMRIWLGDDAHALELLSRPAVDATVSVTDTGWADTSTGGAASISATDAVPFMTGPTTSGVTVSASINSSTAYQAFDDNQISVWNGASTGVTSWVKVDFGAGNAKSIQRYSVGIYSNSGDQGRAPEDWTLQGNDVDTGSDASWTTEDTRNNEIGWALGSTRTYDVTDTGTPGPWRYWRLRVTDTVNAGTFLRLGEIALFPQVTNTQVTRGANGIILNASAIGSRARAEKRVIVDTGDLGVEHSLAIRVGRGPVTLRVGTAQRDDDLINETSLGTGYHNLAFTPGGDFYITLQSDAQVNRIVSSLAIGDSGTVEVTTPWDANDLVNIRYDQSADIVYADCDGVRQQKIERRGIGRSWSVVDYAPDDGPFLPAASSSAKMQPSYFSGNATLDSDTPFFTLDHVGALIRIFHHGQGGQWRLGALDAYTDPIEVTGISDTGDVNNERRIVYNISGTWSGTITIERSINGPDIGFKPAPLDFNVAGSVTDTGTFTKTMIDTDDNLKAWYRAKITSYTSGVATVSATYGGGGVTGIARITDYASNTSVGIEVLKRFSDTGPSDNWQEGYWSQARGFPTAVALHGGRLAHAQGGSLFLSVSDDYENFDEATVGDAAPIIRTLGSGPVDAIRYLISLLRMIIGTAGSELTLRSSSLDEPVTPSNSSAGTFSTQGSANLRAVKMDNRAIFVQRSGQRLFMVGAGTQGNSFGDYEGFELTLLVPDLLSAGVVSIAVQRQPDTRIHCVLSDGRVAILTYEPQEEVICWSMWETDGSVEKAMVLPGLNEDAVYYHIRRRINNANDSYTKVLLHLDGADAATDITDSNAGGSAHVWSAAGNAQIDVAQSKFGGASALFDGTGDYLTTPDSADFALGSSDFTIDFWFNCTAAGGTTRNLAGQCDAGGNAAATSFRIGRNTSNVINAFVCQGVNFFTVTGTTQFTNALNTGWHHLAFVRTGNVLRLFIDGVQEGGDTAITVAVNDSAELLAVGANDAGGSNPWTGWIDEFRLSVGVARWTANFTPPVAAAPPTNVRYLEKWAMESECTGDTGLTWIMDCARSYTDTGRSATLPGYSHLAGRSVVVWSDDTGDRAGVDRSPDVDDVQTVYTVDTGDGTITLGVPVHHGVAGLPYTADWKSTKLAYAAEAGTALTQMKRTDKIGFVLYQTHNRGLKFGSDSGHLDPMPRVIDGGAVVDPDKIFEIFDRVSMPFPGLWSADSRIHLRAQAPRPCTVLAVVPNVQTNEKV